MMISGSKSQIKEKQLKDAVIYVILLIGLDGRKEIGGWYIEFGKENRTDWLKPPCPLNSVSDSPCLMANSLAETIQFRIDLLCLNSNN